jgi:hypothetical protein
VITLPWARRGPLSRSDRRGPSGPGESIDGWLETLHSLAAARAAERIVLARSGQALRVRLAGTRARR